MTAGDGAGEQPPSGAADATALVRRAQAGEAAAVDGLIAAHAAPLVRFCIRLLGDDAAAQGHGEDLAQETLLRALQVIERLEEPARFRAWLFGIAVNLAHKWRRRQARWPLSLERVLEQAPDAAGDTWSPAAKTPELVVEEAEQARRILAAIDALPPDLRRVVVLYYLEELSYRELAAALTLPVSTIKWRLFDSRRRLRSRLAPSDPQRPARAPARPPAATGSARPQQGAGPMSETAPPPAPSVAEQLERALAEQHRRLAAWYRTMAAHRTLTDGAARAVAAAEEEARRLRHPYLGTEHLLLGLVRDESDLPARVLAESGVTAAAVREVVARRIGAGDREVGPPPALVPRAQNVVFQAVEDARRLGHDHVGTEHLLLGLVWERTGIGALVLESLGADLDEVRARVLHTVTPPAAE